MRTSRMKIGLGLLCLFLLPCADASAYEYCSPFVSGQYPTAQTYSAGSVQMRGISLSGGEFDPDGTGNAQSGKFFPCSLDAALFLYRGMNTYRIPFAWEYIADVNGHLNTTTDQTNYLTSFLDTIQQLNVNQGATVIIDMHDYMRYNPTQPSLDWIHQGYPYPTTWPEDRIGMGSPAPTTSAYQTLWKNIVAQVHAIPGIVESRIIYDLMNEPHDMPMTQLTTNLNSAISGIRSEEKSLGMSTTPHLLLVEGNNWSGLHSWMQNESWGQNSTTFPAKIKDSKSNWAIEVHQYFDADSSGQYFDNGTLQPANDCLSLSTFQSGWTFQGTAWPGMNTFWPQFTSWATTNHAKILIGEFGSPDTQNCRDDVNYFLNQIQAFPYNPTTSTGVIGWTAWAAGSSWGDYVNSMAPGGPANTLMWDNEAYQNFLTATASLPALGSPIARLTNSSSSACSLTYSSGSWPFQVKGSARLDPGKTVYMYDNSSQQIQLTYHVGSDAVDVVGSGVTAGNQWGFAYGQITGTCPGTTTPYALCPMADSTCNIVGPNGDTHRCWTVSPFTSSNSSLCNVW